MSLYLDGVGFTIHACLCAGEEAAGEQARGAQEVGGRGGHSQDKASRREHARPTAASGGAEAGKWRCRSRQVVVQKHMHASIVA